MSDKNSFLFQMDSTLHRGEILNQVPAKGLKQQFFFSFRKAKYWEDGNTH